VARLLLTRPDTLSDSQRALTGELAAACPEMTSLAGLVRSFVALLKPAPGNEAKLKDWAETARRGPAKPARLYLRPGPRRGVCHRGRHPAVP
jgi:hypothetical protein